MAGAGLIIIKRRIKSVTNTAKITKAMGMVATAKLRKTREKLTPSEEYQNLMKAAFDEVRSRYDREDMYNLGNGSTKKLYVVLTSDKGLCGSFNATIVNESIEVIRKDGADSLIMVVGQRGRAYFNKLKFDTAAEYVEVPDVPTIKEASTISRHILELYSKKEVGEINIIYTKFINAVKQTVTVEKILPLKNEEKEARNEYILFEPRPESLLEGFIRLYMDGKVLNCLLSSKTSEFSARMNAMDGATRNAKEILEDLHLKFNRVRQSVITQEISEIVGGAEAQS